MLEAQHPPFGETRVKFKPGDLICYNAAGMKYKTLGLVIEVNDMSELYSKTEILVLWGVAGKLMPRKSISPTGMNALDWNKKIHDGDVVWHECGTWFEVVK